MIKALYCDKIHQPITNYFSGVYMTFLSIIEGSVLALIFEIIKSNYKSVSIDYILKDFPAYVVNNDIDRIIIIIFSSILIWHRYINHHQFLGWQITWMDSLFVLLIGLNQVALIFFIEDKYFFYLYQIILPLLCLFAYLHAYAQHKKQYVMNIFYKHYCGVYSCSIIMYNLISNYERKSVNQLFQMCVMFVLLISFCFYINTIFVRFLVSVFMVIYLLFFLVLTDMKKYLCEIKLPCYMKNF
jgi:hypothetical protein